MVKYNATLPSKIILITLVQLKYLWPIPIKKKRNLTILEPPPGKTNIRKVPPFQWVGVRPGKTIPPPPPPQWQCALKTYETSSCASLWVLIQKVTQRWYLTPLKISAFEPQLYPLCWRGYGLIESLFHILWSYPMLQSFWTGIFSLISDIAKDPFPLSPGLALLNLSIESIPLPLRTEVTHVLLAARLLITRMWKSTTPTVIKKTTQLIQTHYTYEKLWASDRKAYNNIQKAWSPWAHWYTQQFGSNIIP